MEGPWLVIECQSFLMRHPWARSAILSFGLLLLAQTAGASFVQAPADRALETAARDVLRRYSTALAALDADGVKKVQPSVDVDTLKRAFREMRTLTVTIDEVRVLSSDESSMRVSCRVAQTLTPRAGARQTSTVTRVMRLRKQEGLWIIEGFER